MWIRRWRAKLDDWREWLGDAGAGWAIPVAYIGECFAAPIVITDVGLFAGVSPRMHGQGTALDEALVAVGDGAFVRSLIGVNAIVTAEV